MALEQESVLHVACSWVCGGALGLLPEVKQPYLNFGVRWPVDDQIECICRGVKRTKVTLRISSNHISKIRTVRNIEIFPIRTILGAGIELPNMRWLILSYI